ncbi:MAG: UDP-glucose 4-epimerase GalE [Prochlorococcus marinus CUG1439]|uniref:UDP-glucose 4-epimerase GalE n=1 Tax=Prochlorococcus sp. MIT 1314 TaxID=3096220 RepID=UPI001B2EA1CA|nr:UDP-glucose 4-epimerase GalE [Prochlorococcus sp. MIT 1314]MCR8538785.1 UDP-glucose 4-epimerase GalE [Prochlorococcus marinus CUG1439]
MKNILVTGGAGFIGSHTCLALLEKGFNVFIIDSFENSSERVIKRILEAYKSNKNNLNINMKVFKGNLCDKYFIKEVFNRIKNENKEIHGVIHFAGFKAVAESFVEPLYYWQNNVVGTINLLEIMNEFNCNNLVFSSSATVYETKDNCLLNESSKFGPINPYGNTKYSIEMLLKDLFQSSAKKWKLASLRYFNPIGAHSSGLLGEDPKDTPNNIFPLIANTALGTQKILKIYGNDWPTKDGTPVRDYIHVMDLAECHLKVLKFLINSEPEILYLNVGTGIGTSVLDLVKTFEKVNNVKIPFVFEKRRIGDGSFLVADNSLLISKMNINYFRSIEDMCRDGWKWKQLNPKGY